LAIRSTKKIRAMREGYALTECYDQPQQNCTAYLYRDGTISEVQGNSVPESYYYQRDDAPIIVARYRQQFDTGLASSFAWREATKEESECAHTVWLDLYDREPSGNQGDRTINLPSGEWLAYDNGFYVVIREFAEPFEDADWEDLKVEIQTYLA
jgi:hypothetical protein